MSAAVMLAADPEAEAQKVEAEAVNSLNTLRKKMILIKSVIIL
jgi:hypothetical protein